MAMQTRKKVRVPRALEAADADENHPWRTDNTPRKSWPKEVTAVIRSKVREIAARVLGQRPQPVVGSAGLDDIADELEQELNDNWQPIHKLYAHGHCVEAILDLSKAPPLPPALPPVRRGPAAAGIGGTAGKGAKAKAAREQAAADSSRKTDNETRLQIESAQGVLAENDAEASNIALEQAFAKGHFDFCLSALHALNVRPPVVDGQVLAALAKAKADLQARALQIADKCLELDWAREYKATRQTPAAGAVLHPAMAVIPGQVQTRPNKRSRANTDTGRQSIKRLAAATERGRKKVERSIAVFMGLLAEQRRRHDEKTAAVPAAAVPAAAATGGNDEDEEQVDVGALQNELNELIGRAAKIVRQIRDAKRPRGQSGWPHYFVVVSAPQSSTPEYIFAPSLETIPLPALALIRAEVSDMPMTEVTGPGMANYTPYRLQQTRTVHTTSSTSGQKRGHGHEQGSNSDDSEDDGEESD